MVINLNPAISSHRASIAFGNSQTTKPTMAKMAMTQSGREVKQASWGVRTAAKLMLGFGSLAALVSGCGKEPIAPDPVKPPVEIPTMTQADSIYLDYTKKGFGVPVDQKDRPDSISAKANINGKDYNYSLKVNTATTSKDTTEVDALINGDKFLGYMKLKFFKGKDGKAAFQTSNVPGYKSSVLTDKSITKIDPDGNLAIICTRQDSKQLRSAIQGVGEVVQEGLNGYNYKATIKNIVTTVAKAK